MKTERRHELETNQLADSLGHWVDAIKPYVRTIVGLVIAVVVLIFAYAYVRHLNAATNALAWDEYFAAIGGRQADRQKLEDLAESHPGAPVAYWSTALLADMELGEGTYLLFKEKGLAKERIRNAAEHYQEILDSSRDPELLERATFGLARAHESLGEIEQARKAYLAVAKNWPSGPFDAVAQQRAKDLNRTETKEFYDWFDKQNPGKDLVKEPGVPGVKPSFDADSLLRPKNKPGQNSAGNANESESGATEPALPGADASEEMEGPPATEGAATDGAATPPADANGAADPKP